MKECKKNSIDSSPYYPYKFVNIFLINKNTCKLTHTLDARGSVAGLGLIVRHSEKVYDLQNVVEYGTVKRCMASTFDTN